MTVPPVSSPAVPDTTRARIQQEAARLFVKSGYHGVSMREVAEAVGVRYGVPFGEYDYTGTLGVELLGVPLLVPLAWVMMSWPAAVVARRLVGPRRPVLRVAVAAYALTAWDLFLDPQMVDAGHWAWASPTPALPGVEGIPLTNFAGWLLVSALVCAGLDRVVGRDGLETVASATSSTSVDPPRPARDTVPIAVYLWTYGSSVMASAVFFGRPSVALVGGLLMGLVAWPLAWRLWREQRERR